MLKDYPDVLDVKDVCAILRIERKTAYRLLQDGTISSRRIGRNYRIPKVAMIKYLQEN